MIMIRDALHHPTSHGWDVDAVKMLLQDVCEDVPEEVCETVMEKSCRTVQEEVAVLLFIFAINSCQFLIPCRFVMTRTTLK